MHPCFNKKPLVTSLSSYSFIGKASKNLYLASIFSIGMLVSGCSLLSSPPMPRGNIITPSDIKTLQVGSTTKADAMDILGSPTTYATFDPNNWIYISMMTKLVPLSYPGVKKQEVLSLYFDQNGTLQRIQQLNKKDAKPIRMVAEVTPTPGTKTNFFQQLLGNIGQYSPLSAMGLGSTFGPGSGGGALGSSNPATAGGIGSSGNTIQ